MDNPENKKDNKEKNSKEPIEVSHIDLTGIAHKIAERLKRETIIVRAFPDPTVRTFADWWKSKD